MCVGGEGEWGGGRKRMVTGEHNTQGCSATGIWEGIYSHRETDREMRMREG